MFKFLSKLFDYNQKYLNSLSAIVAKINSLEPAMRRLKEKDFSGKTGEFQSRIERGETLDELLPEAFALIREAIWRTVGERAFDVQLMAAIALHQGKVAEQKTGEGKTLSAVIAAYLNALEGKGVHIVTVNDYLARRDTGWYGVALELCGLKVGCLIHEQAFLLDKNYEAKNVLDPRLAHLRPVSRQEAYLADVTYGTNNEYGFDYLKDNMVADLSECVQKGHHFAIVDEVDSILIDEARTPLIISAPDTEPTDKYYKFAALVKTLSADTDYVIDEKLKTANLTEHGVMKVEKRLGIPNLYEKDFETLHHIENALKALTLFRRDRDYVVKNDQVVIVDEFTGRLMYGRRWSEGLHQAIEAKEGVKIEQESRTLATISFQNYFRMYEKLAGMTGTAATEAEEFNKIYNLEVAIIPTNKPMIRIDHNDVIYKTTRAKYGAIVEEIAAMHKQGRPVLVGTTSIEKNEIIHEFLRRKGIPHHVLNAKNHEKEAMIISQAGRKGAVTVATNMAGRGVDIILGGVAPAEKESELFKQWQAEHQEVVKLGGLHVIGTERHESRRIDNQLRGRAGRQGDPGSSRFFVSLDDDIMRLFGGEQIKKLMTIFKLPENMPLEHPMVTKAIQQAQAKVESFHFDARKHVVEYDDVMNKQREIIYGRRRQILEKADNLKEQILKNLKEEISELVTAYSTEGFVKIEYQKIVLEFANIIPFDQVSLERLKKELQKIQEKEMIIKKLEVILERAYLMREKQLGEENMRQLERFVMLSTIDRLWIDHLDAIDDLREGIGLRGYGQLDPLVEYKKEAFGMFERLLNNIDYEVNRQIFRLQPISQLIETKPLRVIEGRQDMVTALMKTPKERKLEDNTQAANDEAQLVSVMTKRGKITFKPVVSGSKMPGRNDPCPCGSGKKYKKCCYPKYG